MHDLGFAEQAITIAGVEGPREVQAWVCGPLAYHRTARLGDGFLDTWTVTHVPSGYAVMNYIVMEDAARRAVRAALQSGIDWTKGIDWFQRNQKSKRIVRCRAAMRAALVGESAL